MYVSVKRDDDPRELRKLFVAGVVFAAVASALIWLSIAIYNKTFDKVVTVTLRADMAGLQLPKYGDVRYNGVLVGQVRDISQSGDVAVIRLGLEPDDARRIPANVDADILPTTLFGQKFVSLVDPELPAEPGVVEGTVIPPERVNTAVELSKVLARLFPLLESVRPSDLSATLSALATALNGRGEALGASLDKLDGYLVDINAELPTLRRDLELLGSVANTYNLAAPELIDVLANLTVTSRTISSREGQVSTLLDDVTGLSRVGTRFLGDNEVALERALSLSIPVVRLLEKYAPQHECLLRGVARYKPLLLKTFEGGLVKQFVEFPAPQVRPYGPQDIPRYDDTRGPRCSGLPNNPPIPWPGYPTDNGTELDTPAGRGFSFIPGAQSAQGASLRGMYDGMAGEATSVSAADPSTTQAGRQATAALLQTRAGVDRTQISGLSMLMYSPYAESDDSEALS